MQEAQRLRQELANAKHVATQQEHASHMQLASLRQELEHVTAQNAALNTRCAVHAMVCVAIHWCRVLIEHVMLCV